MLEVFELEKFLLQGGNDSVLVLRLGLLKQSSSGEIAVHLFSKEIDLEIGYSILAKGLYP